MRDVGEFVPLVGRTAEIRELYSRICQDRLPALLVTGASGVGKSAVVDHFSTLMRAGHERFRRVWFQSLYRTSWTSTVTDLRRRLDWVPQNATVDEIEKLVLDSCAREPTLLVLDNADESNVADVIRFVARWSAEIQSSSLIITAQPQIAQQFNEPVPRLLVEGIQSSAALEILGELGARFPERDLLDVSEQLDGNPQKLLFLNWIAPPRIEELKERAANLRLGRDEFAIEDFLDSAGIPGLFLLALGIHRSFVVSDMLLTALWDRFSARGAAAYVRVRGLLLHRKVLTPAQDYSFSIHESVHLQLEKALLHRVGSGQIPLFHHFFAEYYEQALRAEVTTTNLTHFIHHSLAAKNYSLALKLVVDGRVAQALATRGAAVLVRQEMEKLDSPDCLAHARASNEVSLYLRLGALCNDLSDHEATLRYMSRAEGTLGNVDEESVGRLRRQIWYYSAVSFSNLGQSDRCLQQYYQIIDSCLTPDDELACLSLGYLAHDLKYRDLPCALELGALSVDWATKHHPRQILPKNACSYAESLVVAGRLPEAQELFADAARCAEEQGNARELGRIHTNWGFTLALCNSDEALHHLEKGRENSTSVGDRRRQTQAILYSGVAHCLAGDRAGGHRKIQQAADLLRGLGDGRYFVPAFCWAIQLSGLSPRLYPLDASLAADLVDAGYAHLLEHATAHPEFNLYHQFWWRHFSDILGD